MSNDKTNDEGKKSLSLGRLDEVVGGVGTDLSGIQQTIQKIAEQTVVEQQMDPAPAPANDAQKLKDLMNSLQQEQTVSSPARPDQAASSSGAKILDHMSNMKSGYDQAMSEIKEKLATPELSPADMLHAQMKLSQVTMQQDLAGKVVSKSEQNLDTLLKGQ